MRSRPPRQAPQRRKPSNDKHIEKVLLKERKDEELRIKNLALKMGFDLLDYTGAIKKKVA